MNESNLQTLQQQQQPCYVKIIPPTSLIDVLETFYRQGKTQFRIELAQLCCGVSQKQDTYEKIQDLLEVCPLLVKAKRASDGNLPLHICAHLGWVELGSLIANAVSTVVVLFDVFISCLVYSFALHIYCFVHRIHSYNQ